MPFPRILQLCALFLLAISSSAADFTLEVCTEANLRAAMSNGGVIQVLPCESNITLTAPIVIDRDTSLIATQEVVISGGLTTRLFVVNPGVNLRLENIALFSGRQSATNTASAGILDTAGAGIYNNGGNVTVYKGRFQSHAVLGVPGTAGESGVLGDQGQDGWDAAGAAIFNKGGTVTISNAVFEANSATGGPGGKGGDGDAVFGGEGGPGGDGGSGSGAAIYSQGGRLSLFNCVFTNNTVTGALAGAGGTGSGLFAFNGAAGESGNGFGAAVAGNDAEIAIYGCTFVGNQATGADGADAQAGFSNREGDDGEMGGQAAGGAVYSANGILSVTNSTFLSNGVSSGKGGNGGAGGTDGFGGDGGKGGDGGLAIGGAIESTSAASIVHCTFSENTLTAGAAGTGGAGGGVLGQTGDDGHTGTRIGAALDHPIGSLTIANSIFGNIANSGIPSVAGVLTDLGGNLTTDATSLLNSVTSLKGSNPRLLTLANNGGPTPTLGLATNSSAIDKALSDFCIPVDQRGTNRVRGCDIGAFEFTGNVTVPIIPTNVLNLTATRAATNNQVTVLWPMGFGNLFLQSSTNLGLTNSWVTVTNAGPVQGSNFVFSVTPTSATPKTFYRLQGVTNLTTITTSNEPPPFPIPGQ